MATKKEATAAAGTLKPMSLKLEPGLYDRLRKLAFDKRQPMTELMIRGIEMVLKAEKY